MASQLLIVDDSEFMRRLFREIAEERFEVVEAGNGVEAVEVYKERTPDLVVMDIVMPIRDGIEATIQIKQHDANARVIMCTSIEQEEKMKAAAKAGADGYITKPFQKSSVVEAINDVLQ